MMRVYAVKTLTFVVAMPALAVRRQARTVAAAAVHDDVGGGAGDLARCAAIASQTG